jgi:hypothetical protein
MLSDDQQQAAHKAEALRNWNTLTSGIERTFTIRALFNMLRLAAQNDLEETDRRDIVWVAWMGIYLAEIEEGEIG